MGKARSWWQRNIEDLLTGANQTTPLLDPKTGKVDLVALQEELVALANASPAEAFDVRKTANREVKQYDESRRPRVLPGQLVMFEPDALLVVGEGQRVLARKATRQDVLVHQNTLLNQFQSQLTAHTAQSRYWTSRLVNWGANDAFLEDLERRVFGWQP